MKYFSLFLNIVLSLILIVSSVYIYYLFDQNNELNSQMNRCEKSLDINSKHDISIGTLTISKINLTEDFFDAAGDISCIDKSICNVASNKGKNSYFLAAHSNQNSYGFFKNINKLKKGDIAEIISNSSDNSPVLQYKLKDIVTEKKSDYKISKQKIDDNTLVLITTEQAKTQDGYLILTFKLNKTIPFVDEGSDSETNYSDLTDDNDGF